MKNPCKHKPVILTEQVYCSFADLLSIHWCIFCGSTRYNWKSSDMNRRYGKWKSPKNIIFPGRFAVRAKHDR